MKTIAFAISLLGIFILIILLNLSLPIKINKPSELSNLETNTKIQVTGRVISERILYENTKLLKLDNNIELLCQACPPYINRTLQVIGTTETYINRTQISVLKVVLQ